MKIINEFRLDKFIKDENEYFRVSRKSIAEKNRLMLISCCIIYAAVLLFYTIQNIVTGSSQLLLSMYYVFDALHVVFCLFTLCIFKKHQPGFRLTQLLCVIFELCISAFFVIEAIFPFRDEHAIYITIAILLINLLFIHRFIYFLVLNFTYLGSFTILSAVYKTPGAFHNDIYIAVATLIASFIGVFIITRLRHSEDKMLRMYEELSTKDTLTGLYNKQTALAMCTVFLEEQTEKSGKLPLFMMDIDNFKNINDNFGHYAGDLALKEIAVVIRTVFGDDAITGRFGGDEYIAMPKSCGTAAEAEALAARLLSSISELKLESGALHCSIGIAFTNGKEEGINELFKKADYALYRAKNEGKNKAVVIS